MFTLKYLFKKHRLFEPKWIDVKLPESSIPMAVKNGIKYKKTLREVKTMLQKHNFDTDVILQSHEHEEPTASFPIGFPWNWREYPELAKWGACILRLHIGIYKFINEYTFLPHIEPDPRYDPILHLKMFQNSDAIFGEPAIKILKYFLE